MVLSRGLLWILTSRITEVKSEGTDRSVCLPNDIRVLLLLRLVLIGDTNKRAFNQSWVQAPGVHSSCVSGQQALLFITTSSTLGYGVTSSDLVFQHRILVSHSELSVWYSRPVTFLPVSFLDVAEADL